MACRGIGFLPVLLPLYRYHHQRRRLRLRRHAELQEASAWRYAILGRDRQWAGRVGGLVVESAEEFLLVQRFGAGD